MCVHVLLTDVSSWFSKGRIINLFKFNNITRNVGIESKQKSVKVMTFRRMWSFCETLKMLMDTLCNWTDVQQCFERHCFRIVKQALKLQYLYLSWTDLRWCLCKHLSYLGLFIFAESYHQAKLLSIKFMMLAFEKYFRPTVKKRRGKTVAVCI